KRRKRMSQKRTREPIAIVGMGCRFPGAAHLQESWKLLCEGRDAVTTLPSARFALAEVYDPRADTPGKMITDQGGCLPGIVLFPGGGAGLVLWPARLSLCGAWVGCLRGCCLRLLAACRPPWLAESLERVLCVGAGGGSGSEVAPARKYRPCSSFHAFGGGVV